MSSPLENVQLHLVNSIDEALSLKRWLGERREGPIGLDTESGGLDAWRDDLRLVQFGDLHHGWAVPTPDWGGVVDEILRDWEGEWVLHNCPFDAKFLGVHREWDVPWSRVHDTMTLAGLDDSARLRGLKYLGGRLVDPAAQAGEKLLHEGMAAQKWTWATVPYDFAPYWIYGALDPVITAHLYDYLAPRVRATCPDAYDLERGTIRIVTNMMVSGMLVDQPYVNDAIDKLDAFSRESRTWLRQSHGVTSIMSARQIAGALERYGYVVTEFTPTNLPKVDKETLSYVRDAGDSPEIRELARQILAVRHADKLTGTYLSAFLEKLDSSGRLHGSISPMGARTHRMTSSDPNLQNLPRGDRVVRGSFIPGEGNVFISSDLDQIEARLSACITNDAGLIEAFHRAKNEGVDFFCTIAEGIFGTPIVKSDPRRQTTKNVVYGALYGAGAVKMALTAGVPLSTMAPVKAAFDEKYPGIRVTTQELVNTALQSEVPFVTGIDGRHLVCERNRLATQALNTVIQNGAGVYFKRCLMNLEAAGLSDYLRMVIHDEVILEVPARQAEEIKHLVEECMSDSDNYAVPLTAGAAIMPERWIKT